MFDRPARRYCERRRASRRGTAPLGNVLLALGSLCVAVAVLEVGVRFWDAFGRNAEARREAPATDNEFAFYEYDPLLGWRNRPGISATLTIPDSRTHVAINAAGLRDGNHAYQKDARYRILFLGDSFTWGFGVEQAERFTDRLQASLGAQAEVINAGVTGYGTDQELLFLEREGIRYAPDLVVTVFGVEDIWNNANAVQYSYPKPYFVLDGSRELVLRNVPVPKRDVPWTERWDVSQQDQTVEGAPLQVARRAHHLLLDYLASYRLLTERLRDFVAEPDPVTNALLLATHKVAEAHGADFLALLIPYRMQIEHGREPAALANVERFLDEHQVAYLDLSPAFRAAADDGQRLFFGVDEHWNPVGHAAAARALEAYLREHRLVPATMAHAPRPPG